MSKVSFLPVIQEHIPMDLVLLDQWIVWQPIDRGEGKKPGKLPFDAAAIDYAADVSNPLTWTDFQQAMSVYEGNRHRFAGIGFVFREGGDFVGVDLDGCRNADTGEIYPWTPEQRKKWGKDMPDPMEIIKMLSSYTEISPSGTGYKIWIRAKRPEGFTKEKLGDFEFYSESHHFAMTGQVLEGYESIRDAQDAVDQLCHVVLRPPEPPVREPDTGTTVLPSYKPTTAEIIRAGLEGNNLDFRSLFEGSASGYGDDDSVADQAFCKELVYHAGPVLGRDEGFISEMFSNSPRSREKTLRDDYVSNTVKKAITYCEARNSYKRWTTEDRLAAPVRVSYSAAELADRPRTRVTMLGNIFVPGEEMLWAGPDKCLKTSGSLDLGVSVASGKKWLNHFAVSMPMNVGILSAESGIDTIEDTLIGICKSKGISLRDLGDRLHVQTWVPRFSCAEEMTELRRWIECAHEGQS